MRLRALLSVLLLLCCPIPTIARTPRAKNANSPRSFYAVREFFSDLISASDEEILDVEPQGKDVRVQLFQISSATQFCGGSLLRVVERTLPNTTVQKIVGTKVCSITGQDVAAALKSAKPKAIEGIFESASIALVLQCGTRQDVLDFPYPELVDVRALHRNSPRVDALWDLYYKIRRHVFGKYFSFYNFSPAQEKESEELGVKLLPELISGKYDAAFDQNACGGKKCEPNYLAWELSGYKIPTTRDLSTVELVNASSLHLASYEAPQYPQIAKMAHIFGDVHLRIIPDAQTGAVKEVQFVSGNQLLRRSAMDAAKKWSFSPGSESGAPIEAVLKFSLCGNM